MFKEDADTFYKAQTVLSGFDNEYIDALHQEEPAARGERQAVAIEPLPKRCSVPFPEAKGGIIAPLERFTEPGEFRYFSIAPDDDGTLVYASDDSSW